MESTEEVSREVERRLEEIRSDPARLKRYDLDGDGEIDASEWDRLRRVVTLEVQTERERQRSSDDTYVGEPHDAVLAERFEVDEEIRRGARGSTYHGRDLESGAVVAIRQLVLRDADAREMLEAFERRVEILRQLDHPGIPAYLDAFNVCDEDEGTQRFFLVEEHVEGDEYGTRLDEGLMTTEAESREILEELLEILVYLQERSPPVIHRDINPANLVRCSDRLALVGFRAVPSVVPNADGGSTIIGTSGYMPAEQLMGREVPATDLYAAGATIVHLVSHQHPADL